MASEIKVDTISEKTSANGVTIDGVSLKDSKIATANSVDSDAYVDASIDNAHLADNAVDTAEIADNAVTLAKMDGLARGKLIYGDASGDPAALAVGSANEVLTHDGTDLAWAAASGFDVSSITGATALGATPADTDEFVLSDAGVLKRVDYSYIKVANTPYFKFRSDGQTITTSTDTLIEFDTEVFKSTDSAAFDTTNHRYLPTTAGYYVIHSSVRLNEDASGDRFIIQIRKNGTVGSADGSSVIDQDINDYSSVQATALIECDGSSDYIDAIIYQNTGSDKTILGHSAYSFFEGYRLIG